MPLKIAVVGRPNVGKSTLFNRLAGRKLAIVNDQPGVTRDRREARGRLGDLDLVLIDTAGFEDVEDDSLQARMRAQTERALEDCDLCLFVLDAREGLTSLDRIFADLVRRRNRPVVVLANKAEGRSGTLGAGEAFGLGLGEPLSISAEHGEGLGELYARLQAFADAAADEGGEDPGGEDAPVRIAVVGRPNAGKSTLVNRLLGEDRLLTGPEAGITRDAISVDFEHAGRAVRFVDTAGLRRKARVDGALEKLSVADAVRAINFAEIVILVMDAASAFETQDLQIADLVEREGRGLVFCLAKWDLVEDPQRRLGELRETAERVLPQVRGAPIVALSAKTGWGVQRLIPAALTVHEHWGTRVKTRDLNDWLAMAVQRHPPPAVNGRRIKPKYMAQLKGRPPTFVLFASRAEHLPESYRRYLVNSLRESFDLPGVPIRVSLKSNRNPFVEGDAPPPRLHGSRPGAQAPEAKPEGPGAAEEKRGAAAKAGGGAKRARTAPKGPGGARGTRRPAKRRPADKTKRLR